MLLKKRMKNKLIKIINFVKQNTTSHNRSVTVRRPVRAARLRETPVGASPLCGVSLRHIFLRP
jgi:hypothetical protein